MEPGIDPKWLPKGIKSSPTKAPEPFVFLVFPLKIAPGGGPKWGRNEARNGAKMSQNCVRFGLPSGQKSIEIVFYSKSAPHVGRAAARVRG